MPAFNQALEAIRSRLYTVSEFPVIDPARLPTALDFESVPKDNEGQADLAFSMSGKQVDGLLLAIPSLTDKAEIEKAVALVRIRFSRRIVKLVFSLYQTRYETEPVQILCRRIAEEATKRDLFPEDGSFLWTFFQTPDPLDAAVEEALSTGKDLDEFFARYHIGAETALSFEIRRRCLEVATNEMFVANQKHMLLLIGKSTDGLDAMTANYLDQFIMVNYLEDVNVALLGRLGEPGSTPAWESFSQEQRDRFAHWVYLFRLKTRSREFPKKYEVLSQYYNQIKGTQELEDGSILILDFGSIVVADLAGRPYSYFYKRHVFEEEMRQWISEGIEPCFLRLDRAQVSARDYIIEQKEAPCMRLHYEGVEHLYIQELLDIKMGLEPDFRRKNYR